MLLYDNGLFLLRNRLGLDVQRPLAAGFISHAHFDHMAKHQLALCTSETAALYQHRLGNRPVRVLPYQTPVEFAGVTLTAFPAGHMLGSAMLMVEHLGQKLLYTGDFQLRPSLTCRSAIVPKVDTLVMECTFGGPQFSFLCARTIRNKLVAIVRSVLMRGNVPVIEAYVAGKAQEATRILTDAGISVSQHPEIYSISRIYEDLGCPLGSYTLFSGYPPPGSAVLVPPAAQRCADLGPIHRQERIAITGWAVKENERKRRNVHHAIPLSDHADYTELLRIVELSEATVILCTHGPMSFSNELRSRGYDARHLHRDAAYCPLP